MTAQLYIGGRGLVDVRTVPDSGSRLDLIDREAGACSYPLKSGGRVSQRWRVVQRMAEEAPDGRKRAQREALAELQRIFDALDRMPMNGLFPAGFGSAMPDVVRSYWDAYKRNGVDETEWDDGDPHPAIPSAREIAEIDRLAQHLLTLAPADRVILSGLGLGLRYDVIARKVGLSVAWTRERGDALLLSFAAVWGG